MDERSDDSIPVRSGEELPVSGLEDYFTRHLPGTSGPLTVRQFAGGHSNLTYLLRLGEADFVLRRAPFGNVVKSAHDMAREYRVLSKLWPVYSPAPRPLLFCDDPTVMDVPFYVMERRQGIILRRPIAPDISIDPPTARRLSTSLVDALADLHGLDYNAAGLGDLGKPNGYVARQVGGWIERYAKAQTSELPEMERTARWLADHLPPDSAPALIHNDFKYDNLVLDPHDITRVAAVLDWEMATVGDPLMDLGTTLGYWVEAGDPPALRLSATGPTDLDGNLTRRELADRYAERTGRDVKGIRFFYVFGLYKIAVIVQQIYARYVRGHTRDPRFARLDGLVKVLAEQADGTIGTGRL